MADPGVGIVNVNGTDTLPVTYVYTINTGTKGVLRVIGQTPTVTTDPYRVTVS